MGFFASVFISFFSMFILAFFVYWLDRYEKEPRLLVGFVFFWGAVIAAAVAFLINTVFGVGVFLFSGSEAITEFTTGSLVAPIIEETLKGIAVMGVFLLFRSEFDSILDGILYAAVTALGFAATENAYYIYNYGFLEQGWVGFWGLAFIRIVVLAWQHPFYTSFFGIGLAIARLNRNPWLRFGAPMAGWLVAVLAHSFHNTLAGIGSEFFCVLGSILDWSGWITMFIFIVVMIFREKKILTQNLKPEVEAGIITETQYQSVISSWKQVERKITALFSGNLPLTLRYFQICGEIAHKKNQISRVGDEKGNLLILEKYRKELEQISPRLGF